MTDEHDHIPDIPVEAALELGEIDLAIADILASLDESLSEISGLEPVDRSLIIHHVRWAYIEGWTDRHFEVLGQQGLNKD